MTHILASFKIIFYFLLFFLIHSLVNTNFLIQNFLGAVLFILFIISSSRRPTPQDKSTVEYPPVSIIIPMRNEERNVTPCLLSLMSLDYPCYEIIVANDSSTDGTREAVLEIKKEYDDKTRLTLIDIHPLQEGWTGKTWALHNAVKKAKYDIWLIADADVRHTPQSLKRSVAHFLANQTDIMTRTPWPIIYTPGEWPMIYLMFLLRYSSWFSDSFLKRNQSFPTEQYVLMSRKFYGSSGGYSSVRDFIPEIMALVNIAHRLGKKVVRMDDDLLDITVRMYEGRRATTQGIVRAMDFRVISFYPFLAISLTIAWVVDGISKIVSSIFIPGSAMLIPGLISYALFSILFTWYLSRSRHLRIIGLFAPIIVLNFIYLTILSIFKRTVEKQVIWRGRIINVVQLF